MSSELAGGIDKFVERELRHFYNYVVQNRFKAGLCLFCYKVWNFIQGKAYGDERGDLGDWIAGGLARERRRSADSRVDLDDSILKAVRVQGELAVTASLNFECAYNIKGGASQHLIFFICKGNGWCYYD